MYINMCMNIYRLYFSARQKAVTVSDYSLRMTLVRPYRCTSLIRNTHPPWIIIGPLAQGYCRVLLGGGLALSLALSRSAHHKTVTVSDYSLRMTLVCASPSHCLALSLSLSRSLALSLAFSLIFLSAHQKAVTISDCIRRMTLVRPYMG
jgi:hypothetical protein